ncbi:MULTISPECIES: NrfD/PsrC family molybdoenzyme membrane anchor subunit [Geobacter]|uniref:NrfD/PsrC family molybdoenzyme membrane anchor subunit n=1 Tax=Geobacter TaxID=28231 RepID=UPI0025725FF4|nr:NrfD/PsrC family molybdoenzyme membrane anchor subunit [Geobacter sulfurreducens]BEH08434.1 polysulfide reductase NrfD [Geobacter sulfurreducens subsp. ethanolicus]BET59913.1 polysulfide reductase NrfD [Geobacter sp. 60473]
MVHGEAWTVKELFVYPNEYIYWTIQIVMYPFLTGLVAGAFVLSSLYHVFGVKPLKDIARFSLVFSFALLPCAPLPLLLHLQQPLRNHHVLMTPHFTSAIAAFGIVFLTYGMIVASELWFVYRGYFAVTARQLKGQRERTRAETIKMRLFSVLVLGAWDVSHRALEQDEKAVKILAAVGIPVACFLHGYAGFIFGSVKANALWMTPLMPVIFICSAVVSGIALCILTYIVTMELRKFVAAWRRRDNPGLPAPAEHGEGEANVVRMTSRYLIMFLILAITLELLDLIFRGYTAVKSWDILRSVIYGKDFVAIFVLQYGLGNLVPFILFLLPGLTVRRAVAGTLLVLFGVFMMRWNVVIGGQAFSASFAGFMHYHLPIIPHDLETFKEGLFGALAVGSVPFVLFWLLSRIFPVFGSGESD